VLSALATSKNAKLSWIIEIVDTGNVSAYFGWVDKPENDNFNVEKFSYYVK